MKSYAFLLGLILISIISSSTYAKKMDTKSSNKTSDRNSRLSTEMNFNDMMVRGKYQYSGELAATVEKEKSLADLLGVRKDFKDRMLLTSERN